MSCLFYQCNSNEGTNLIYMLAFRIYWCAWFSTSSAPGGRSSRLSTNDSPFQICKACSSGRQFMLNQVHFQGIYFPQSGSVHWVSYLNNWNVFHLTACVYSLLCSCFISLMVWSELLCFDAYIVNALTLPFARRKDCSSFSCLDREERIRK